MANELEILTENAAGNSWVDLTPGAVSTGYQAQNTNIEAGRVGMDATYARASGSDVIVDPSGPVDVSGLPFVVKEEVTLTPGSNGTYYIHVVDGSSDTQKELELSTSRGSWVADKNALYDGSTRVLNWQIVRDGGTVTVTRLLPVAVSLEDSKIDGAEITDSDISDSTVTDSTVTDSVVEIAGGVSIETPRIRTYFWGVIASAFDAPGSSPRGLTYDSSMGNLISCDSVTDKIYIHDGVSSTVLSSFDSPDTRPLGLAYDSSTGNLISCDYDAKKIYIHDGISSSILSSFDTPDVFPIELTYDSSTGNLISCDIGENKIYIHDGVSSSILSSFDSPANDPYGLTYDSSTGNLISSDSVTDKIYIHDGVSSSILSSFDSPGIDPHGLAYDSSAGNLISCDDDTNKIYIHAALLGYY